MEAGEDEALASIRIDAWERVDQTMQEADRAEFDGAECDGGGCDGDASVAGVR